MTDVQLKHNQPDLSDNQVLLALLAETLEMARDLEATQSELQSATGDALNELIQSAGLPDEIEDAAKTAQSTLLRILAHISEQDLDLALTTGLLTQDDHKEALKAMRTLSLSRSRFPDREQDRET